MDIKEAIRRVVRGEDAQDICDELVGECAEGDKRDKEKKKKKPYMMKESLEAIEEAGKANLHYIGDIVSGVLAPLFDLSSVRAMSITNNLASGKSAQINKNVDAVVKGGKLTITATGTEWSEQTLGDLARSIQKFGFPTKISDQNLIVTLGIK